MVLDAAGLRGTVSNLCQLFMIGSLLTSVEPAQQSVSVTLSVCTFSTNANLS